ncbi:glycosyltransferase [Candidatus Frankia alpina]|uniref:glycosyltransferase n=1 Tax=Candidatus Frankia alpina TaxID=2699483 RepID=UPI0013D06F1E|nr:glycosyltransferase family 2 protein [Candidatus Frankia alpina]
MRTSAVIVHWGPVAPTVDLTRRLSVLPQINDVIVVANDLRERPDDVDDTVIWIVPSRNLGFGGGFRHACGTVSVPDCYLLLNNDVRLESATIDACLDLLARPDVGIVGPTLVNAGGLYPGVTGLTSVFAVPRRRRTPTDHADDVPWVTGAIMFIKAECHQQVPMHIRYFLYYEDLDLCLRARRAGWRVLISPAQAWHTGGGSVPSDVSAYYPARNRLWFARTHGRPRQVALAAAWLFLAELPRSAFSRLVHRREARSIAQLRHALRGAVDGIGPMPDADSMLADEPRTARWASTAGGVARPPHPRAGQHSVVSRR